MTLPRRVARSCAAVEDEEIPASGARGTITVVDRSESLRFDRNDAAHALAEQAQAWLAEGCDVTVLVRRTGRPSIDGGAVGELPIAIARLHASSEYESVAALLASTPWSRLHTLGLSQLRVVLGQLPLDVLRHHPGALVGAAQFAESEQRAVDARAEWLGRADELVGSDHPLRPMLDVEIARDLIRDLDVDQGRELAARVLEGSDPIARARALHTLAKVDMWDGTAEAFLRAEGQLRDAITGYRMHGEEQWEATAWLELGWTHNMSGAFDRALDSIERAVHLLGAATSQRASTLTFHADVLIEVGRYEEAAIALREAAAIARDLDDHAGLAYAAWGSARLRSRQRDHAGTIAYLRQVELHRTDWYRRPAGASFHGEAAEMLVHLGDEAGARDHLTRAMRLDAHHHSITDVPTAMFDARFGEPARARKLLAELIADPTTRERDRWRYLIYAAWAEHRAADDDRARSLADLALRSVEALGRPDLLAIGEPELHAHFFGGEVGADDRWEIRVLGDFELRRNGLIVRVPPGGATWLVQHLALFGARSVDEVTDRLWPDADVATGRRRLRNLLHRMRSECGELIERVDARLRLSPRADIDLMEFQRAFGAVATAPAAERSGIARVAITRATGALLAGVDYDDDVAVLRERVRRQVVDLLDLVATDAIGRSDHAEASRLLEQAIELEPHDESRYETLATLLVELGRPQSAYDVVSRGLAIATDLEIEPSHVLTTLAGQLADPM